MIIYHVKMKKPSRSGGRIDFLVKADNAVQAAIEIDRYTGPCKITEVYVEEIMEFHDEPKEKDNGEGTARVDRAADAESR